MHVFFAIQLIYFYLQYVHYVYSFVDGVVDLLAPGAAGVYIHVHKPGQMGDQCLVLYTCRSCRDFKTLKCRHSPRFYYVLVSHFPS